MNIKIYVNRIDASHITSKIKGYFILDNEKFNFNGIAFGRIGGHNINIKLSKKDQKRVKEAGYDPEDIIIKVQRMMIEGDLEVLDNNEKL